MRRFLALALLISVASSSCACLNDRDSDALAVQNARFPDALRVITGRFERNPPRFYQLRIKRVQGELKAHPRNFDLYDDLAVAHDRLGDDEAALKVMAAKRAVLPLFNAKDKANREAWYRYFANDGTFRAHRFLHDGAKVSNLGQMKQARAEIKRALEIKPNAHFGREKYQLAVMDWILATKTKKTKMSLADFLDKRFDWQTYYLRGALSDDRQEAAQGLAGLIVLGAAWQSPDVFDALAGALRDRPTIGLSHLALRRCDELLASSARSLAVAPLNNSRRIELVEEQREFGLNTKNAQTLDAFYPKLRAEADAWNASRAKWMETKFAQNQHPDTNTNFWSGWKEAPPPSLDVAWFNDEQARQSFNHKIRLAMNASVLLLLSVSVLLFCFLSWRVKRKTSRA